MNQAAEEGIPTPSVHSQFVEIEREIKTQRFQPGDSAFALSNKWFVKFKKASKINNTNFSMAIDNTHLRDENGKVKQWLVKQDYVLISEKAWNTLIDRFTGGPAINVHFYLNPKTQKIESTFIPLSFNISYLKRSMKIYVSRDATVKQLREVACKEFDVNVESRLRGYENQKMKELPLDDDKPIQSYDFMFEAELLLEAKINGCWPNIKPAVSDKQNYNTASSSFQKIANGVVGIHNPGVLCYQAAVCQALGHCLPFRDYIIGSDGGCKNVSSDSITDAIQAILKEMWNPYSAKIIDQKKLCVAVQRKRCDFNQYTQQDAHELLLIILDAVIAETSPNKQKEINVCQLEEGDDASDQKLTEIAEKNWKKLIEINQSPLFKLFYCLQGVKYICSNCKHQQTVFSPISVLQLDLEPGSLKAQKVIWVPYDRTKEIRKCTIHIGAGATFRDYVSALSGNGITIGFKASVAFAVLRSEYNKKDQNHNNKNDDNNNDNDNDKSDDKDGDETNARGKSPYVFISPSIVENHNLIAFEIPDKDQSYFLIVSLVKSLDNKLAPFDSFHYLCMFEGKETQENALHLSKTLLNNTLYDSSSNNNNRNNNTSTNEFQPELKFYGTFIPSEKYPCIVDVVVEAVFLPTLFEHLRDNKVKVIEDTPKLDLVEQLRVRISTSTFDVSKECSKCKATNQPDIKTTFWHASDILIIQLMRWDTDRNKNNILVEFPDDLDMTKFIADSSDNETSSSSNTMPYNKTKYIYKLFAVVRHIGNNFYFGHYIACAKIYDTDKWYELNDSMTTEVEREKVHSDDAYLLFYQRFKEQS